MPVTPSSDTPLAAGETLHLPVDAGTVLFVAEGAARIEEPPRWLAGTLLPVVHHLAEGQAHTVETAGWIRVQAAGAAGTRLRQLPAVVPHGWPLRRFARRLWRA